MEKPVRPVPASSLSNERDSISASGPKEPLTFNHDRNPQYAIAKAEEIFDHLLAVAKRVKIPANVIYAMRKTGRIVTDRNKHLQSAAEAAEWKAAIDEYRKLN